MEPMDKQGPIAKALVEWLLSDEGMNCFAFNGDDSRTVTRVDAVKTAFVAGAEAAFKLIKKGESIGSPGKG
jgi:hypothetical protein